MADKSIKEQQKVTFDKFDRPTVLRSATEVYSKSKQAVVPGIFKTYIHLGGQDYKVEISTHASQYESKKHGSQNRCWVKVTKLDKKRAAAAAQI